MPKSNSTQQSNGTKRQRYIVVALVLGAATLAVVLAIVFAVSAGSGGNSAERNDFDQAKQDQETTTSPTSSSGGQDQETTASPTTGSGGENQEPGQDTDSRPIQNRPDPGAPPTLPVIDGFLFAGYDLLFGNPTPTRSTNDPGFRQPIFTASYSQGSVTGDARYSVPDGISVTVSDSCSLAFSSTVMESVEEYSEKLSINAAVSGRGRGWGVTARFSASVDYQEASDYLFQQGFTMMHSQAECAIYKSRIDTFSPPPFSANFLAALETLPESYDQDLYATFLKAFGTHYVTETTMGAIFGEQSFISESNRKQLFSTRLELEASASASGFGAAVSASGGVTTESNQVQAFRQVTESRRIFTRGSRIPLDGEAATWANSAFENPQPIGITIAGIDTIQGLATAIGGDKKMENLRRAILDYCAMIEEEGAIGTCAPTEYRFSAFSIPRNFNGGSVGELSDILLPPIICDDESYVVGIEFDQVAFVGLTDVTITCSNGEMVHALNPETRCVATAQCPQGFDSFQGFGQVHTVGIVRGEYNLVGMEISCFADSQRTFIGYREPNAIGEALAVDCGPIKRIVGIQVALNDISDGGLTRFRVVCREM